MIMARKISAEKFLRKVCDVTFEAPDTEDILFTEIQQYVDDETNDINATFHGETALIIATSRLSPRNYSSVLRLIEILLSAKKIDMNKRDSRGYNTALLYAVENDNNSCEITKRLVNHHNIQFHMAHPHNGINENGNGCNALGKAILKKNIKLVQTILPKLNDVQIFFFPGPNGKTPLEMSRGTSFENDVMNRFNALASQLSSFNLRHAELQGKIDKEINYCEVTLIWANGMISNNESPFMIEKYLKDLFVKIENANHIYDDKLRENITIKANDNLQKRIEQCKSETLHLLKKNVKYVQFYLENDSDTEVSLPRFHEQEDKFEKSSEGFISKSDFLHYITQVDLYYHTKYFKWRGLINYLKRVDQKNRLSFLMERIYLLNDFHSRDSNIPFIHFMPDYHPDGESWTGKIEKDMFFYLNNLISLLAENERFTVISKIGSFFIRCILISPHYEDNLRKELVILLCEFINNYMTPKQRGEWLNVNCNISIINPYILLKAAEGARRKRIHGDEFAFVDFASFEEATCLTTNSNLMPYTLFANNTTQTSTISSNEILEKGKTILAAYMPIDLSIQNERHQEIVRMPFPFGGGTYQKYLPKDQKKYVLKLLASDPGLSALGSGIITFEEAMNLANHPNSPELLEMFLIDSESARIRYAKELAHIPSEQEEKEPVVAFTFSQ